MDGGFGYRKLAIETKRENLLRGGIPGKWGSIRISHLSEDSFAVILVLCFQRTNKSMVCPVGTFNDRICPNYYPGIEVFESPLYAIYLFDKMSKYLQQLLRLAPDNKSALHRMRVKSRFGSYSEGEPAS